ncbi:hypothetical protein ACIP2Y_44350 [Streptomyces sviceus]|uniref:hypothetical protein n=1 Tax=Streptomyces sviceus TaxID=285530 RepID=UPI0037F9106D
MTVDSRGNWDVHQTNGATVHMNLDQDHAGNVSGDAFVNGVHGGCQGFVRGDDFLVTIEWDNGPKGRYTGHLGLDLRLSGETVDINNPGSTATWFSDPLPMMV